MKVFASLYPHRPEKQRMEMRRSRRGKRDGRCSDLLCRGRIPTAGTDLRFVLRPGAACWKWFHGSVRCWTLFVQLSPGSGHSRDGLPCMVSAPEPHPEAERSHPQRAWPPGGEGARGHIAGAGGRAVDPVPRTVCRSCLRRTRAAGKAWCSARSSMD